MSIINQYSFENQLSPQDTLILKQEIVRLFSEKKYEEARLLSIKYLNTYKQNIIDGKSIDMDFFDIIFTICEISDNEIKFLETAKIYAEITKTEMKSWITKHKKTLYSNDNVFNVELMNEIEAEKLETYCHDDNKTEKRINFYNFNIHNSNSFGLEKLLVSLRALRENDNIDTTIMSDNVLLDFDVKDIKLENITIALSSLDKNFKSSLDLLPSIEIEQEDLNEKYKKKPKGNDIVSKQKALISSAINKKKQLAKKPKVSSSHSQNSNDSKTTEKQSINADRTEFNNKSDKQNNNSELVLNSVTEVDLLNEHQKIIELLYLLKMEIYQWKGEEEKYNYLAIDYMERFKKIPHEYNSEQEKIYLQFLKRKEKDKSVFIKSNNINDKSSYVCKLKEIDNNNIQYVFDFIDTKILQHTEPTGPTEHTGSIGSIGTMSKIEQIINSGKTSNSTEISKSNNLNEIKNKFTIILDMKNLDHMSHNIAQRIVEFIKNKEKQNIIIKMTNLNILLRYQMLFVGLEIYN
jgi:hypothetical protein